MSEQLSKQEALLHSVSRAQDNFKKIGRQNCTAAKIRSRISCLKDTWSQCIQGHAALLQLYPEKERIKIAYFKEDQLADHEEVYLAALDTMTDWLEELEPPVSPNQTLATERSFARSESSNLSLQHLPPIKLPPFSGNFSEWENFRDRFTALIINNKELSNFSRMHFLASSVTGSAREALNRFTITVDNFSVAWKALHTRFENKKKLINLHISTLYNLPTMSRESAVELHALRDKADQAISALKSLGRSSENILNDILVYFVTQKFDNATRRAWKLKGGSEESPLAFEELIKFMTSRAFALEELDPLNSKPSRNVKVNNATTQSSSDPKCPLCKQQHYFNQCEQFLKKSPTQRRELVKQSKRCFNCLSLKHSVKECPSKFSCRTCQQRHHSLLHIESSCSSDNQNKSSSVNNADVIDQTDDQAHAKPSSAVAMSAVSVTAAPKPVLLATAKVVVESPAGRKLAVRALLDQGSEVTLITENVSQLLHLRRKRTLTTISAVGCSSVGTCRSAAVIQISARDRSEPAFSTVAFILPSLTKYNPRCSQSVSEWEHLRDLRLADDNPTGSEPIEIIIGADLYSRIILNGIRKGSTGQPIAQNSHFGWWISGPTSVQTSPVPTVSVSHCTLDTEIKRFWEVEELPSTRIPSPEETQCEKHFLSTHSRTPEGRYIVRLPFRKGPPIEIGESRSIAIRKLAALNRRLELNADLKKEYAEFLSDYETLNHMERVPAPTIPETQTVYIPHHAVIRDSSSTTRLRVVFNASSASTNGTSLNSHLLTGPKLQADLITVLLKWRQFKYVYIADIAKMYRQILVDPLDRNYQRILWRDRDSHGLQDFQLSTVTYGTASAPFLALRVIKQLVHDEGDAFPLAESVLRENIYVDDVLFGAEDIPLLRRTREQLCNLLSQGGFTLRKWASNRSELLADLPDEDHGLACNRVLQIDDSLNILGISWSPALDAFQYRVELSESVPRTKRTILSAIAKLFDPLGWVTPITVAAKIFMQQLWRMKLDWDDAIPPPTIDRWNLIYQNLAHLNGLRVPRWTGRDSDTASCELHGFADASTAAYAAAAYMRFVSFSGEVTIRLLIAKSKVSPIKPMTIPRLELLAAQLLARLLDYTREALNMKQIKTYCWTDSTIVLAWLKSHPSRWATFVSNRVADIQHRIPEAEWRYVSTHENPADCASRGYLGGESHSLSLWWQGPIWLHCDQTSWPSQHSTLIADVSEEAKPPVVHLTLSQESWDLAFRFSSWSKLLKVTAYILRFTNKCRKIEDPSDNFSIKSLALTATECKKAQSFWIRTVQFEKFPAELSTLKKGHAISPKSSIASLSPFLDDDNIIRVGGRLGKAPISFENKHPAILAAHPVVKLIVQQSHVASCHSGVQLTIATLRQTCWILRARNLVKQIIYQCVKCTREKAAVPNQLMGQLPQACVSAPTRPFLHCGVDYAGPVATRLSAGRGIRSNKGYIALFICLASRAIHLELVSDYSASAFLNAFSRFCARRGLPTCMYSDNGTTFVGAEKEINQAYRDAVTNTNFLNKTAADKVSWKFIPPHAPHFGGLWEAGVRSLKHHLRRVLGPHTLTFEEFTTLLCRIEACLNSRPIGQLNDTLDDYEPLTPGHFIIGSALTVSPEPSVLSISENRLSRWQLIRHITERFWKIWQSDYVNALQQRGKWKQEKPSIKVGTMVLIKNQLLPPCKWELGRVTQTHAGSDGLVRVVSVRTAHSEYQRPIVKLCILPIAIESPTEQATNASCIAQSIQV